MPHDHDHDHASETALRWAAGLTLAFMVAEAVGGWWTGSLALLADAAHMLSDAGALVVALLAARIARRPPDGRRTMGYRRAEVLAALLNAVALGVLAVWIVVEAGQRLLHPSPVMGAPMLAVAVTGLLVNGVMAWILRGSAKDDINLRAALWHVLGDALGSVGAIVAAVIVWQTGWTLADPLVSVVIAGILVLGASRVGVESVLVLMQSAPPNIDVDALRTTILSVPGVAGIHALHTWCLTPGENVLTVHVVVDDDRDPICVAANVRARITEVAHVRHVTVQPERRSMSCRCEESPCPS